MVSLMFLLMFFLFKPLQDSCHLWFTIFLQELIWFYITEKINLIKTSERCFVFVFLTRRFGYRQNIKPNLFAWFNVKGSEKTQPAPWGRPRTKSTSGIRVFVSHTLRSNQTWNTHSSGKDTLQYCTHKHSHTASRLLSSTFRSCWN